MEGIEILPEREKRIISSYSFKDFFDGKMDNDEYLKQLELFKPQLEGIIDSSLLEYLQWLGKKQMSLSTFIPDNTLVKSQIILMTQYLLIKYSELKNYFNWIKKQENSSTVEKASYLTIKELKPDVQKWEEANKRGVYSLGTCINYDMCTCFHRAVFFNLLMQQVGIESLILEGRWIENNQENLETGYTSLPYKSDYHLWNIILYKNKYLLIDTSFLIDNKPVLKEINFVKNYRGLGHRWTLKSSGQFKYRHYSSSSTIEIEIQPSGK